METVSQIRNFIISSQADKHFASFYLNIVIRTPLLYAESIISSLLLTSAMCEVLA